MAYQALYRKWRPLTFEDVRGQDHIVTTLKNQIGMNRIGHAYLFCGTRGTGKTSVAKIFARAVNCENPVDGSPCGECEMCRAALEQRSMNVIEIDAASNNGVDNIRQIRDEVAFSPAQGKYKVYIIDEVHMLSTGAFNALLKTLEEPPSYVIFILATTEPHRIPVTILSRCQRYDFHRITSSVISGRLHELAQAESIDAEDEALDYIARMGDGSMRDALSLLDQCVSFYIGKRLTYDNVLDVLGAVDMSVFSLLFRSIADGDAGRALGILDDAIAHGRDVMQFTQDLTMYFRNLMMVQCGDSSLAAAYVSRDQLAGLEEEAHMVSMETVMRYIRILSEFTSGIRYSTQKRVLLEITLVKMCRPAMETDYSSLTARVDQLEKSLENVLAAAARGEFALSAPDGSNMSASGDRNQSGNDDLSGDSAYDRIKRRDVPAQTEDVDRIINEWENVFKNAPSLVKIMAGNAVPGPGEGNQLIIYCEDNLTHNYFKDDSKLEIFRDIICDYVNAGVDVRVRTSSEAQIYSESSFDPMDRLDTSGIEIVEEE